MTNSTRYPFFASVPKGLEDLLEQELTSLGVQSITQGKSGVAFNDTLAQAYKVCLHSRIASRVLLQLKEFDCPDDDVLYEQVKQIDWSEHFDPQSLIAIDCTVVNSTITNSHYATLRIKDAIVDQCMERFDERPSIDIKNPEIRLNAYIFKDQCTLSLDLAGDPLHKRGYRVKGVTAPLKENLAAALLMRTGWPQKFDAGIPFFDPLCGSGTLVIEAALMEANIAPGVLRGYWGFYAWRQHDDEAWEALIDAANEQRDKALGELTSHFYASDNNYLAVKAARANIREAGLADVIDLREQDAIEINPPSKEHGLIVTNPPYGERLGEKDELRYFYAEFAERLKHHFGGWTVSLFTSNDDLAKQMGMRAHKQNKFNNGPLKATLFHYRIRDIDWQAEKAKLTDSETAKAFANRLKKNLKHYNRWAKRNQISCYRVYYADIPDFSLAVDIYTRDNAAQEIAAQDKWVVVQEFEAPRDIPVAKTEQRLKEAMAVIPDVIGVSAKNVLLKQRRRQKGQEQYEKQDSRDHFFTINENGLTFSVNLHDYLDTGIFLDHRITRTKIREWAQGKKFLNLFCYTGSVTVYAADGGAVETTSVDMSNTYLDWAERNLELNGFSDPSAHRLQQADCTEWLANEASKGQKKYGLIFLDPPTFSNSKRMRDAFDVQSDHEELIEHAMSLLEPDGKLVFSNNFKKFRMSGAIMEAFDVDNISSQTIPEDFSRNKKIHNCWVITHK